MKGRPLSTLEGAKLCTRCRIPKPGMPHPEGAFYANRTKKDGLADWCVTCERIAKSGYIETGKQRESTRRWIAKPENVELHKTSNRRWRSSVRGKEWESLYRNSSHGRLMNQKSCAVYRLKNRIKTDRGRENCRKLIADIERELEKLRAR